MKHLTTALAAFFLFAFCIPAILFATVPAGFVEGLYVSGLTKPTAMAFAPDGRLFVCEQGGNLRVISSDGILQTNSFLTVTVDSTGERGLLGVAFDPDFATATTKYVYIYYTATTPTLHNRVSRFIANGDVAQPNSETILLELDNLSATNHNGGAIHFGSDGKLYIAAGENAVGGNAQIFTNLLGKMLRINPDGTIPTNPFDAQTTGKNKAIWAMGLRNPFTFAVQPGTGRIFINDVGEVSWEEINDGIAGSNYGWNNAEGIMQCGTYRCPLFAYAHGSGSTTGCAIAGGAFYNPAIPQFPGSYTGKYFFQDLCSHWIRVLDPATNTASDFGLTTITSPVDLQVRSDGTLYYLARGGTPSAGAVYSIKYSTNPSMTINNQSVTELPGGTKQVTLTVTLSSSTGPDVTVHYQTADGTAVAPADYVAASGDLTIPGGQTSGTISLLINGDTVKENNEHFFVNLSSAVNANITDPQGKVTINNLKPELTFNHVSLQEGNSGTTNAVFNITLNFAYDATVTVDYSTMDGTATAPSDYTTSNDTLTIPAFSTNGTISVPVAGDTVTESDETFTLKLSNAFNAVIKTSNRTATILNDDAIPALSINDIAITEGNSGTQLATFTIAQSFATATNNTVKFATANGTASASKGDYVTKSLTVTIPAGSTSVPVSVTVNGDTLYEANETFFGNLSNPTKATIADSQGIATIQNDDVPPLLSIGDISVTETNSNQTVQFTVTLSTANGLATTVNYTTADGSADSVSDYATKSGTVTINAGATSATFSVTVKGGTVAESDENFFVNLSNPGNATISDSQGECTIHDND